MNVLLTCAGRRNYLVKFFKDALRGRGQVIACDCSETAPALTEADRSVVVPRFDEAEYVEVLLSVCREHAVRLIVGVNDLELADLAREAPRFRAAGTLPVVAAPKIIATCQDKWATFYQLRSLGVATPDTYLSIDDVHHALARGAIRFPLVIKPRWGTSSIGVECVENDRELTLAYEWGQIQLRRTILANVSQADLNHMFVFQEWLDGQEYGMDIVNDFNGRHVATLARRKLAMRAGNTDRAITVADPALECLGQILGRRLAHLGSLDCDLMATDRGYLVIDLNPRFGGGYPFSHMAGANIPAALVAWADGTEPDPAWLRSRPGVVVSKHDGLTVVEQESPSAEALGQGRSEEVARDELEIQVGATRDAACRQSVQCADLDR
jgi:carbamoyl-phosphate synthase large subunit